MRVRFSHVALVIGVLSLFMILPAAAADLFGYLQVDAGPRQLAALPTSSEDLQATINALYTDTAPGTGTPWSQGQLETSVAGTMSALQRTAVETVDHTQTTIWTTTTATTVSSGGSPPRSTSTKPPPPISTSTQPPTHTQTSMVVLSPTVAQTVHETLPATDEPTVTAIVVESQTPTDEPTVTATAVVSQTATSLPSPTLTPVPPTPVPPTADPCAGITLNEFSFRDNVVRWRINNDSIANITVSSLRVHWPSSNVELERVRFDSATIWNRGSTVSPTNIGGINRWVRRNRSKSFTFIFDEDAAGSGYQLTVNLTNGCSVTADR